VVKREKIMINIITFVLFTSFFIMISSVAGLGVESNDASLVFTDADAEKLKNGDYEVVSEVLYKLVDIYEEKGKKGLKPAVPFLLESAKKELKIPEDERWNIYDIVKVLCLTGDKRTKPMLLHLMSTMRGGGNPFVAQGFLAIGKSIIKDVTDSLKSVSSDTKGRAALTVHKMYQFDETGKFFSKEDREKIKKLLTVNLDNKAVNVRIFTVAALSSFGDESVIPKLEHIEKYDAHKDSGGTYEVRIEAAETLKKIKAKKKPE